MFRVCLSYFTVFSIPSSSHVITCWERADLLALLCVMFLCVFVSFPFGVSGQVWYLIVSIPDLCLLFYFHHCLRTRSFTFSFLWNFAFFLAPKNFSELKKKEIRNTIRLSKSLNPGQARSFVGSDLVTCSLERHYLGRNGFAKDSHHYQTVLHRRSSQNRIE